MPKSDFGVGAAVAGLPVGSFGYVGCVGSAGCVGSVGFVGSVGCEGSVGCVGSVGWVVSVGCVGSVGLVTVGVGSGVDVGELLPNLHPFVNVTSSMAIVPTWV